MQITRTDVLWNYGATFLRIASSVILFPFILRMMPPETIGIWSVFMTITAFVSLLDFGFNSTFARNVAYIFSGVKSLKINGHETICNEDFTIDYRLLKGVISSMRWFYSRMSIVLLVFLMTLGTYYIHTLLKNYKSNPQDVYIAWVLLCTISTYNLYTLYYESLMQGKGLIKRSKQIVIIGQTVYLVIAAILISKDYGLIAIISAQASSVIIVRLLSYRSFFTKEIKQKLHDVSARSNKEIIKVIYPNAIKMGLTSLGSFMAQRSAILIGSLYVSLQDIASFGITLQIIALIASIASIYTSTFQPKIAQLRISQNKQEIKEIYLKGQLVLVLTYLVGGLGLLILGEIGLEFIGSQTQFLSQLMIFVIIIISLLENNHGIAGAILLSRNEVPFFKASLISGAITIILLIVMLKIIGMQLWAMILAPGIAHLYNNWKWPYEVTKQLNITIKDIFNTLIIIIKRNIR